MSGEQLWDSGVFCGSRHPRAGAERLEGPCGVLGFLSSGPIVARALSLLCEAL